jgi:hypothetical protein
LTATDNAKFLTSIGGNAPPYLPNGRHKRGAKAAVPLIISEGPIKALSCVQAGVETDANLAGCWLPDGNHNYWKTTFLRGFSNDAIAVLVQHANGRGHKI